MKIETKLFGITVDDMTEEMLEQMQNASADKGGIAFVLGAESQRIQALTAQEVQYARALNIPTMTGSEIQRAVNTEIDRRCADQQALGKLLAKSKGADPTREEVEEAWAKIEADRKAAGPRIVPPRLNLRTEERVVNAR